MAKIKCIYGTTGGNTELVVEKVATLLEQRGHEVSIQRVENSKISDAKGNDLCILAASTYGHGIMQEHFAPFAEELKKTNLAGYRYAVIGLGDDKYDKEYNIESAALLEEIVHESNGEIIYPALKINKDPVPQLNTRVVRWTEKVANII